MEKKGKNVIQNYKGKIFFWRCMSILVEASFRDSIWGIGLSEKEAMKVTPSEWKGRNLLGYSLMAVRDYITEKK